jgi:hypothetical protein
MAQIKFPEYWGFYGSFGSSSLYQENGEPIKFSQEIKETGFKESCEVTPVSNYSGHMGMTWAGYGRGIFIDGMEDWDTWHYEFGAGLSYSNVQLERLTRDYQSSHYIFDFYQMGPNCNLNNGGINMHLDLGGIIYVGFGATAGVSILSSSGQYGQKVSSTGWYLFPDVCIGTSLTFPFWNNDADFKINFKAFVSFYQFFTYHNRTRWSAPNKTDLRNFSNIQGSGTNPNGLIGIKASVYFRRN